MQVYIFIEPLTELWPLICLETNNLNPKTTEKRHQKNSHNGSRAWACQRSKVRGHPPERATDQCYERDRVEEHRTTLPLERTNVSSGWVHLMSQPCLLHHSGSSEDQSRVDPPKAKGQTCLTPWNPGLTFPTPASLSPRLLSPSPHPMDGDRRCPRHWSPTLAGPALAALQRNAAD